MSKLTPALVAYRDLISFDKVRAAATTAIGIFVVAGLVALVEYASEIDLTPTLGPIGDPLEALIVLGVGSALAAARAYFKPEHNAYGAGPPPRPPADGSPEAGEKFSG